MKVIIKNWYRIGGVILLVMAGGLILIHPQISWVQWLLIFNFMALLAHQVEEYQLPGGAPTIINRVVYNETTLADRYPGNELSICLVNTSAWVLYVLSICFSRVYWLGLGLIFFSLFQILGHGLEMNIKLHTWYNPGLATTIFLFLPIGIAYIETVTNRHLLSGWDWFFAVLTLLGCILVTIILPVQSLKDKSTKYVISPWQLQRCQQIIRFAKIGGAKR